MFNLDKCVLQLHRLIQPLNRFFFLSCQSLVAPQNLSPTQTRNPFYHPRKTFNFSDSGFPSFSVWNPQMKLDLKESRDIH